MADRAQPGVAEQALHISLHVAGRTQDLYTEIGDFEVVFRRDDLGHGGLDDRVLAGIKHFRRVVGMEPRGLGPHRHLGEFMRYSLEVGDALAEGLALFDKVFGDIDDRHALARCRRSDQNALQIEPLHEPFPAAILLAEHPCCGNADIVEEHLVQQG